MFDKAGRRSSETSTVAPTITSATTATAIPVAATTIHGDTYGSVEQEPGSSTADPGKCLAAVEEGTLLSTTKGHPSEEGESRGSNARRTEKRKHRRSRWSDRALRERVERKRKLSTEGDARNRGGESSREKPRWWTRKRGRRKRNDGEGRKCQPELSGAPVRQRTVRQEESEVKRNDDSQPQMDAYPQGPERAPWRGSGGTTVSARRRQRRAELDMAAVQGILVAVLRERHVARAQILRGVV